jgi:3-isopropylmalate/(R)-2-methylmalate dehydratase small subunit
MLRFTTLDGLVIPLDRANVDTDAIIPKQFLKSIRRTGFGCNLFDEWRYLDPGEPGRSSDGRPLNQDFCLNQPRYRGAQILLARENFGCGSSREHAVWAIGDYGLRALVAPSFADIFFGNCLKNGVLPVVLDAATIGMLFEAVTLTPGYRLRIDLEAQNLTTPEGSTHRFDIEAFNKNCLLNGLDDVELTLADSQSIKNYESMRRLREPWLFEQGMAGLPSTSEYSRRSRL